MFSWIFGKPKQETDALATLDKLNGTLEMLEKKEKELLKKAAAEAEKVKEFTKENIKWAVIGCLKRKRRYDQLLKHLSDLQSRIQEKVVMLEGAKATTETLDALRTGASAIKAMQKAANIDDVDKIMDEINELYENMKQMQEALSTPIGSAADFDEDELELEAEELERAELDEQFLNIASAGRLPAHASEVEEQFAPAGRLPARARARESCFWLF